MTQEIYDKVCKNISEFIEQEIDKRDDPYLTEAKNRIIDKFINEVCNESNLKMKSCTEKETEVYREMMGINNNGEKQTYKQVCKKLNKHNIRPLIFNANRKLMSTIYKEILFEDKVKLIQIDYKYQENKGMILPEDIEIDNLRSIIYYEYELLKSLGIESVKDIIKYTIPEITNIISALNTRRRYNKEEIPMELVNTIHLLGFVFKNEVGYDEQLKYFDKIRIVMNSKTHSSDGNEELKKQLYLRKELIKCYSRLEKEKKYLLTESKKIEQELDNIKEEIILSENKIKQRKK